MAGPCRGPRQISPEAGYGHDVDEQVEGGLAHPGKPDELPGASADREAHMENPVAERAERDEVLRPVVRVIAIQMMHLKAARRGAFAGPGRQSAGLADEMIPLQAPEPDTAEIRVRHTGVRIIPAVRARLNLESKGNGHRTTGRWR